MFTFIVQLLVSQNLLFHKQNKLNHILGTDKFVLKIDKHYVAAIVLCGKYWRAKRRPMLALCCKRIPGGHKKYTHKIHYDENLSEVL